MLDPELPSVFLDWHSSTSCLRLVGCGWIMSWALGRMCRCGCPPPPSHQPASNSALFFFLPSRHLLLSSLLRVVTCSADVRPALQSDAWSHLSSGSKLCACRCAVVTILYSTEYKVQHTQHLVSFLSPFGGLELDANQTRRTCRLQVG